MVYPLHSGYEKSLSFCRHNILHVVVTLSLSLQTRGFDTPALAEADRSMLVSIDIRDCEVQTLCVVHLWMCEPNLNLDCLDRQRSESVLGCRIAFLQPHAIGPVH